MYAIRHSSGELCTYQGAVIVHSNRPEMQWLIPSHPVVELAGDSAAEVAEKYGRPAMNLRDHPDLASVRWPLNRNDFWAKA